MERLTQKAECGTAYTQIPLNKSYLDGKPCFTGFIADHLASYEDIGLTPADIADLKNEYCLLCGKYKTAHMGSCDGCRWKEKT